jgi:hypothetical protein
MGVKYYFYWLAGSEAIGGLLAATGWSGLTPLLLAGGHLIPRCLERLEYSIEWCGCQGFLELLGSDFGGWGEARAE